MITAARHEKKAEPIWSEANRDSGESHDSTISSYVQTDEVLEDVDLSDIFILVTGVSAGLG